MQKPNIVSLKDMVPHIHEHLLPAIQQSVEICVKSYWDDQFNDMWIFGTHLWKNIWNRFEALAEFEDCPFEACGKGNEYKLKIGPYVIRHHRINNESKLPTGAKAVKSSAAHIQMMLFEDDLNVPVEIDNIVVAIDADVHKGLKEVFVGELMPLPDNSKKYRWEDNESVFLAEGVEASDAEIISIANMIGLKQQTPAEEIPEVAIQLDKSITDKKKIESDRE